MMTDSFVPWNRAAIVDGPCSSNQAANSFMYVLQLDAIKLCFKATIMSRRAETFRSP